MRQNKDKDFFALCPFYLDLYVLGADSLISQGSYMQTKHLCVLIHIRIKGETRNPEMSLRRPIILLLTIPRLCASFVDHFLYIIIFCGSNLLFVFVFFHTAMSVS